MERETVGFHRDEIGDWVAELSCGHGHHVRHKPPFQERPWVLSPQGRRGRLGLPLACPRCDRAELPEGLVGVRITQTWDEKTLPPTLTRAHRVAKGTWGVLRVDQGEVRFEAETDPKIKVVVSAGSTQPIPPVVPHHVEPLGPVRFCIEFLKVGPPSFEITTEEQQDEPDQGGEAACYVHMLCPQCGTVLDGSAHSPGCSLTVPGG
ncbi:MAG: DUF3565 domain-containing protein [Acidimicrobiales bacterium]